MDLDDLKERGFLGKDLVRRMGETLPGVLAHMLDDLVYGAVEGKSAGGDEVVTFYRRRTVLRCPEWRKIPGADKGSVDAVRLLREVSAYLEACALREALGP